jgi:hypothetical protein
MGTGEWTGDGDQSAVLPEEEENVSLQRFDSQLKALPLAHEELWSITPLPQTLSQMTNLSAQFQTDNKSRADRGTGGGTGGIGRCP